MNNYTYEKTYAAVTMVAFVGVASIGFLPLDSAQGADLYGYNDWGMDYGYNDWGTDYVDYSYQPFSDYSYQPYADYSYQPFADYSYQPFSDYSYQPFYDYSYQPFQDYSYQPFSDYSYQPYADYSYEPFQDYSHEPFADYSYQPFYDYPYYYEQPYYHVPVPQPQPQPQPQPSPSSSALSASASNSNSNSNSDAAAGAEANANTNVDVETNTNVENTNTNTNINPNTNNNTNTNTVTNTINFPEINLSQQQQVSAQLVQPPTCTIWAHPTKVEKGGSAMLTWYSNGATSATLTYVGSVPVSGSQTVTDIWGRTEYILTVTGEGGTNICKTIVDVKEYLPTTVTYAEPKQPYYYQPAPHVSLRQVPYTGFTDDALLNMFMWLGMTAWAGGAGYYLYAFRRGKYAWLAGQVA